MIKKIASIAITLGMLLVTVAPAYADSFGVAGNKSPDLGLQFPAASGLGNTDVRITAAKIIRVAMSLLGIMAVCIILFGGFTWMTAGGNDEQVGEAKKWIFSGIIGLVIILSAYALATFVINALVNATTSGETNGPLL